jgi:hypothetical protein
MLQDGALKRGMAHGALKVYTGAQPANADAAPTGSLLCTYSLTGGALTREVRSAGSVVLNTGAAGSVNTLTVNGIEIMGGAVNFNTSLAQTATDVCTKINNNPKNYLFQATNGGTATITITAKPGLGALPNAWAVVSTVTTLTKTDANMAGGVDPVNGLNWAASAAGTLTKESGTWQGTAVATGTAGWFRLEASVVDAGGADAVEAILRLDGAIATSGAELNMGSTSIVNATVQTISSFSVTLPTA